MLKNVAKDDRKANFETPILLISPFKNSYNPHDGILLKKHPIQTREYILPAFYINAKLESTNALSLAPVDK